MIHLSTAGNITISHLEEIHERTIELNKLVVFYHDSLSSAISMTLLNQALALAFMEAL